MPECSCPRSSDIRGRDTEIQSTSKNRLTVQALSRSASIHGYVRTYIHTYIHTHTYIYTYIHNTHTYIHACIPTYIHIHKYIHTYTHIHTTGQMSLFRNHEAQNQSEPGSPVFTPTVPPHTCMFYVHVKLKSSYLTALQLVGDSDSS
jgi:hypothetical protein